MPPKNNHKSFSTDRQVANLQPHADGSRIDYPHKTIQGLKIRVSNSKKSWLILYRLEGRARKITLPTPYPTCSLAEAIKECTRIRGEATKGKDPLAKRIERKQAPTIADVMDLYFKETTLTPSGRKESERITHKDILPQLGHLKAQDLQRFHVKTRHSEIVEREAPIMANRVIELMRRAFNHAFEEELIKFNNFPAIRKMKKEEPTRERFLTDEEIAILWPAFDSLTPNMRDIHKLLLLLGQRTQDTCAMALTEIDPKRKEWTVPAPDLGKNHKPNVLPLPPLAWEIIEPRLQNSKWIFPSDHNTTRRGYTGEGHTKKSSTYKARRKLTNSTGVTGWTGHDLRRTLRTLLSREGVPPHIAERVLGHVQGGIEGVYDRYAYLEEKGQALRKLDRLICKLTGQKQEVAKIFPLKKIINE